MSSFRSTGADVAWSYVDGGNTFACSANGYKLVTATQRRLGLTADGVVNTDFVNRLAVAVRGVATRFAYERDNLSADLTAGGMDAERLTRGAAIPSDLGEAILRGMVWYAFYQGSSSAQEPQVHGHDIAPTAITVPGGTVYPLWGMPLAASTARGTCAQASGQTPAAPPASSDPTDLAATGTYLYGGPTTTPLLGIDDVGGTGATAGSSGGGSGANNALGTYLFGPPSSNPLIGIDTPTPTRSNVAVIIAGGAAVVGLGLVIYFATRKQGR